MSNQRQYRNDEPHANDNYGTQMLAVRKDVAKALAGTDGDYIPFIVDATGRLHFAGEITSALPAGDNNIGNVDVLSIAAGINNIGKVNIVDNIGNPASFSIARDMRTVEPVRLVGTTFGGAIDTALWTATTSGAGSASGVAVGLATLSSGTENNGFGQLTTVHKARFMFVHPQLYRGGIRMPSLTIAECTRRWGAYTVSGTTPQDGFYFELSDADVLSVNHVNGSSVTKVSSGAFNGSVASFAMDTNVHFYEVVYFEAKAQFIIDKVLIHEFTPTIAKLNAVFDHPVTSTTINSASGTTSGSIEVFAASILRLGKPETDSHILHISGGAATYNVKSGPGKLHKIIYNNTSGTTVTIYDNTAASGLIIGIITTAQAALGPWEYDAEFEVGLTIVTTGNNLDATVVFE